MVFKRSAHALPRFVGKNMLKIRDHNAVTRGVFICGALTCCTFTCCTFTCCAFTCCALTCCALTCCAFTYGVVTYSAVTCNTVRCRPVKPTINEYKPYRCLRKTQGFEYRRINFAIRRMRLQLQSVERRQVREPPILIARCRNGQ